MSDILNFFNNSSVGFVLFEAIRDESDHVVDFFYKYINDEYYNITGLDKRILDRDRQNKAQKLNTNTTEWFRKLLGVLSGENIGNFEHYSTKLGKWYVINMFSPDSNHISAVYTPIPDKHTAIMSDTALQLSNYRSESLIRTMAYQSVNMNDFLNYALSEVKKLSMSNFGRIYLHDESSKTLRLVASSNGSNLPPHPIFTHIISTNSENILTEVLSSGKAIVQNTPSEENDLSKLLKWNDIVDEKYMLMPIDEKGKIVAIIILFKNPNDFIETDIIQVQYFMEAVWNVAKRKQAEETLELERSYLKMTLKSINEGIISVDENFTVISMNKKAEELIGLNSNMSLGKHVSMLFKHLDDDVAKHIKRLSKEDYTYINSWSKVIRTVQKGQELILQLTTSSIIDDSSNYSGFVVLVHDITQTTLDNEHIRYISYHDILTGLYNRRFFEEEMNRLNTDRHLPLSILIGDLNGLKLTNDAFGHSEGDKLLLTAANILTSTCRKDDIVARWGGDEFVLLLPNTTEARASQVAKKIQHLCINNTDSIVELSISIGIATKTIHEENINKTLMEAENNMYNEKLTESRSQRSRIIDAIKKSLYERNHETEEHAERLIRLSLDIAKHLNLHENDIQNLRLLALLHDIGKIGIPDNILLKPGPLNEDEWIQMRKHPYIGYTIASASPDLAQISRYILHHHEKFDGTGYPDGLKGKEIPLLSRIISVADAFDAMNSDRPYRKAIPAALAIDELKKYSGTQFDPEIVEVFVDIYNS